MQAQQAVAKQKAKEEAEETLDRTPANRLRLLRTVVDLLQENETPMMVCIRRRARKRAQLAVLTRVRFLNRAGACAQGLKRLGGQKTSAGHRGKAEAAAPVRAHAATSDGRAAALMSVWSALCVGPNARRTRTPPRRRSASLTR